MSAVIQGYPGPATFPGKKIVVASSAGPSSYATGGFDVVIDELTSVDFAIVVCNGGYIAEVASITGNTVKVLVRYFDYDAAAGGTAIEVASGTDLSGVTFTILAVGS